MFFEVEIFFSFQHYQIKILDAPFFKYHILDARRPILFSRDCFNAQMVLNIFIEAGVQNCSDVNKWRIGQEKFELTILEC